MVVLTKSQQEAIWEHLLVTVLEQPKDNDYWKVLETSGIVTVTELIADQDDVEVVKTWYYDKPILDASGSPVLDAAGQPTYSQYVMKRHEANMTFIVKDYIWKTAIDLGYSSSSDMKHADYMKLEREGYDRMRTDPNYKMRRDRVTDANTTSSGNNTNMVTSTPKTAVDHFRKSIKRDQSAFPVLKTDDNYDTWNRGTVIQARIQDVAEVLDEKYTPIATTDKELFNLKKQFMYGVFERTLATDKGKSIVRKYQDDADSQKVYRDTKAFYTDSVKARFESSKYLRYITTAKYDQTWTSTSQAFVIYWQEQARLYNSLVPKSHKYKDTALLVLLQIAVDQSPELRGVYNLAQQLQVSTGDVLDYDKYVTSLLSACVQLDDSQGTRTPKPIKTQRGIYSHEIDDTVSGITDGSHFIGIDTPVGEIEAYFMRRRGVPNSSMTKAQWIRLSPEGQTTWDTMTSEDKAIILEPRPPPTPKAQLPTNPNIMQKLQDPNYQRNISMNDISAAEYLQYLHESSSQRSETPQEDDSTKTGTQNEGSILSFLTKQLNKTDEDKKHPANLQRMMSSSQGSKSGSKTQGSQPSQPEVHSISWGGRTFIANTVDICRRQYNVSKASRMKGRALVDRGANGGVAGNDVYIVNRDPIKLVDITGVENHQVKDIYIGTVAGMVQSTKGPVIAVMHQQALLCKGSSIISSIQMEAAGCDVNDKSMKLEGGKQRIIRHGHVLPLTINNGLPRLKMRPCTETEYNDVNIPHVILTDDLDWDPTILDNDEGDDLEWFDAQQDDVNDNGNTLFDQFGDYKKCTIVNSAHISDTFLDTHQELEDFIIPVHDLLIEAYPTARENHKQDVDFETLRPNFAWQPTDIVKRTFECTTQYGRLSMGDKFQKHYRSPHPALNVHRRDEDVATDTVYSDTAAIDDGSTIAQFFCGTESLVCDIYGIKTEKQFVNTLQDNIRTRGAMNRLLSDRAQVEISDRVQDFLRLFCIGDWQSEPKQQQQNPSERRYQTVKRLANTIMSRTGSPAYTWLLALLYICYVLNHSACSALNYNCPLNVLHGSTTDCSAMLRFSWWQLVEYKEDDTAFPSDSPTHIGHFVGFSENVGHQMTVKILTLETKKVIHRGNVRSAESDEKFNWKAVNALDGEDIPIIIKSIRDRLTKQEDKDEEGSDDKEIKIPPAPIIPIKSLIGRTFLMDERQDGERHRARIVKAIDDNEKKLEKHPDRVKFICTVNDDEYEEILSYNEIINHIENHDDDQRVWKFKRIVSHEGPMKPEHADYRGSKFNVMIEWENGEVTREPLSNIAADDPVTCAIYARENDLLEEPGWKRFRSIAKRQKKMFRMANQAKLRSFRTAPKYMYGFEIPRDYRHALELDEKNGNHAWRDCTVLEFEQLDEYDTFKSLGMGGKPENGFKKIKVHLVFAAKHDGRHKARCVADGHLTDIPVDSVYSGVVSLRGIRMLLFLAELNGLKTWGTDIGNAYLEAITAERVYIIAGPEFGEREGETLIIYKALYGLRSSGLQWHKRFAAVLRKEGFTPCKMEPDIWLRKNGNIYEYIAVYVDDLAFAMRKPGEFTNRLINKYKFKLKGTGEIEYHLGCDFSRDEDGTLCMHPKKYIQRMVDGYIRMFGDKPNAKIRSPLEENDHPEVDASPFLDADGIAKYQSLIGSMQWAISLGRMDIATACMTLSGFRSCPRVGHLERAKRVIGYLSRMSEAAIRFRTKIPDYSDLPGFEYDWDTSIYGDVREEFPHDAPAPLGGHVVLTHFIDANLYHDLVTGRSVTGILHFINQTPIDWYSKKQGKVETATYGSEFMAARTAVETIMDLRLTFRYLGVPIDDKSYMFGDNEAVVNSASKIDSKLHKRHNALSFHRVREAIASKMVDFHHIPGKQNPADVLSKHWAYGKVWQLLRPLLFWEGDTGRISD